MNLQEQYDISYIGEIINEDLKQGKIITVTFTKKDGSNRVMRCTKNMEFIPTDKHPSGNGKPQTHKNIVVFDLDAGDWRSFTPSSVTVLSR